MPGKISNDVVMNDAPDAALIPLVDLSEASPANQNKAIEVQALRDRSYHTGELGSVTATALTGPATTNLTLTGGSSGASLVLGQGTNQSLTLTPSGTGSILTSGNVRVKGQNSNAYDTTICALDLQTGRDAGGALIEGQTTADIGLAYGGGYFRHFITTNHAYNSPSGCSVNIWVNDGTMASTAPGTGNVLAARFTGNGNVLIGGTTDISGSGGMKVFGTTASTSTTTGSLINAGGFGNSGAAYIGGNLSVSGTGIFSSASNALIVSNSQTPDSASATGTTGTIAWDDSYIYVCTATNTWKRVAISTW